MSRKKCKGCGYLMTWASARVQYVKLVSSPGFNPERAKAAMPLCDKCVRSVLHRTTDQSLGVNRPLVSEVSGSEPITKTEKSIISKCSQSLRTREKGGMRTTDFTDFTDQVEP